MGRKLYVGNLPYETNEDDLQALFAQAGAVESVNVMRDRETGRARGFAFVSLDVLFAAPGVRTPLNVVALFTTAQPFGPFMSLDGTHPNAAGQALIAEGAAEALNARYDLGIPVGEP